MTNLNLFNTTGFNTDAVTTVLRAAFTTDGVDKDDPNQAFVATPDARVWGFHPASLVADAIEGCKIGAGDTDMKESFMPYPASPGARFLLAHGRVGGALRDLVHAVHTAMEVREASRKEAPRLAPHEVRVCLSKTSQQLKPRLDHTVAL